MSVKLKFFSDKILIVQHGKKYKLFGLRIPDS